MTLAAPERTPLSPRSIPAPGKVRSWLLRLCVLAGTILLLLAPLQLDLYWLRVLSLIFMYGILAQSINLIAGFAGYPAFGNVVFFGIGAYSTAIVMVKAGGSFVLGVLCAVLACLITVIVLGPALLRLRGHYFAIATVGLNEMVKALVANLAPLTGGGMGLSVPLPPWRAAESAHFFYYLLLSVLIASTAVAAWFKLSRIGYACRAVRDDEVKAEAMGLRTTLIKTIAWAFSAVFTGMAGAIYAYWFSYIDPPSVFDLLIAIKSFVIFLFGGAATVLGPVVAAFFIEYLSTVVWSRLLDYHLGIFGVAVMLLALFMPHGVVQFARDRSKALATMFGQKGKEVGSR
jgi:branched-chain amino acid transport system permease protein